jgi:hypothetical protein
LATFSADGPSGLAPKALIVDGSGDGYLRTACDLCAFETCPAKFVAA